MTSSRGLGILLAAVALPVVALAQDVGTPPEALLSDGSELFPGTDIARVVGSAASILRAERISLNFLQRMSGIASDTHRYVQAIRGLGARIVDTRKTAPGHRYLDKYAVRMGGGHNHRLNLADGILVKDNHIQALRSRELGLPEVIQLALSRDSHTIKVEVEVETLEQVREAVAAGAHIIMLDNMPVDTMRQAMEIVAGRAVVEASGGIDLDTVRADEELVVLLPGVDQLPFAIKDHQDVVPTRVPLRILL